MSKVKVEYVTEAQIAAQAANRPNFEPITCEAFELKTADLWEKKNDKTGDSQCHVVFVVPGVCKRWVDIATAKEAGLIGTTKDSKGKYKIRLGVMVSFNAGVISVSK